MKARAFRIRFFNRRKSTESVHHPVAEASMELDGSSILALASMLRGAEGEPTSESFSGRFHSSACTPGSIQTTTQPKGGPPGVAEVSRPVTKSRTETEPPSKASTKDIWDEDEVETSDDLDWDTRQTPE